MTQIEHINITVPNIDHAIKFIQIVAPDFKVRKDVKPNDSHRCVHIGNEYYYFALQQAHIDSVPKYPLKTYENYGVNHIALVVDDILKVETELLKSGYKRSISAPLELYRKRLYFF